MIAASFLFTFWFWFLLGMLNLREEKVVKSINWNKNSFKLKSTARLQNRRPFLIWIIKPIVNISESFLLLKKDLNLWTTLEKLWHIL